MHNLSGTAEYIRPVSKSEAGFILQKNRGHQDEIGQEKDVGYQFYVICVVFWRGQFDFPTVFGTKCRIEYALGDAWFFSDSSGIAGAGCDCCINKN